MRDVGQLPRGCTQAGKNLLLGFPFHDALLLSHGTMAIVFAPALVTRVEHLGGDLQSRSHGALLLNELRRQVVGPLELCSCRNDTLGDFEAAAFAEPR